MKLLCIIFALLLALVDSFSGCYPVDMSVRLEEGSWIKLICGASNEDIPQIRNIAFAYTLAGVDCIDCAADPSIVSAVDEGIRAAQEYSSARSWLQPARPWIMVSINDDADPHFRKAAFDPSLCPADCPRPCEATCPVLAISQSGVDEKKCYGCGRCLSSCPLQLIHANNYVRTPQHAGTHRLPERQPVPSSSPRSQLPDLLIRVDAIEIHTSGSTRDSFRELWQGRNGESGGIEGWASSLKLVSVSFPDQGETLLDFMLFVSHTLNLPDNVEMTDGRPMSGDVGHGTARASIALAQRVLQCRREARLRGGVQLAGGTNDYTATLLARNELFKSQAGGPAKFLPSPSFIPFAPSLPYLLTFPSPPPPSSPPVPLPPSLLALITPIHQLSAGKEAVVGAAFGGYARKLLRDELLAVNALGPPLKLEEHEELAASASSKALAFVTDFKATALAHVQR
ncbi:hypothetical protein GUITHDRAFT_142403 [Guillardia theta CCMP2712]|uniref:4Fe-4S ferredoxin-type domain-containing protein n=1 Tax=Guillardia theta (strain CCMP2712) TaxID=905079 RepID=L1IXQ5_GUITC|nr:hypothetical protein GUITHDRAFT_142403 [Guillardia theta CCMP2712]EKX41016.1 hypothetical protein GUITHDRAFT_142403 [Guillardia theta CCMP2712]|eukprot:XP_005827996.1 hypothetical protein GUITHDRAFT_142403 [Guillardia theta CCMP2712]